MKKLLAGVSLFVLSFVALIGLNLAYIKLKGNEFDFNGTIYIEQASEVIREEAHGYANVNEKTANQTDTVYVIGSITKQFTAAGVATLFDSGQLNPEDTLSAIFDDVPADKANITVHQLLTHSSGLFDYHTRSDFDKISKQEAYDNIMQSELLFPPGQEYAYSNSGYTVLAMIIEEITGQTYIDYMHTAVFEPAGLTATGFYGEAHFSQLHVADGYRFNRHNGNPATIDPITWGPMGNGEILSTTHDLAKWFKTLHEGEFLSAATTELLFTPFVQEGDYPSYYGYGWVIEETEAGTIINHDGGGAFGNAKIEYNVDQDLLMIVLSNRVDGHLILGVLPYYWHYPANEMIDELKLEYYQ